MPFPERTVFGTFAMRLAWNPVAAVLALVFAFSASSVVAELLALLSEDGVPPDLVGAVWDSHHPHRWRRPPRCAPT